jgi:hypothetical protein
MEIEDKGEWHWGVMLTRAAGFAMGTVSTSGYTVLVQVTIMCGYK